MNKGPFSLILLCLFCLLKVDERGLFANLITPKTSKGSLLTKHNTDEVTLQRGVTVIEWKVQYGNLKTLYDSKGKALSPTFNLVDYQSELIAEHGMTEVLTLHLNTSFTQLYYEYFEVGTEKQELDVWGLKNLTFGTKLKWGRYFGVQAFGIFPLGNPLYYENGPTVEEYTSILLRQLFHYKYKALGVLQRASYQYFFPEYSSNQSFEGGQHYYSQPGAKIEGGLKFYLHLLRLKKSQITWATEGLYRLHFPFAMGDQIDALNPPLKEVKDTDVTHIILNTHLDFHLGGRIMMSLFGELPLYSKNTLLWSQGYLLEGEFSVPFYILTTNIMQPMVIGFSFTTTF